MLLYEFSIATSPVYNILLLPKAKCMFAYIYGKYNLPPWATTPSWSRITASTPVRVCSNNFHLFNNNGLDHVIWLCASHLIILLQEFPTHAVSHPICTNSQSRFAMLNPKYSLHCILDKCQYSQTLRRHIVLSSQHPRCHPTKRQ